MKKKNKEQRTMSEERRTKNKNKEQTKRTKTKTKTKQRHTKTKDNKIEGTDTSSQTAGWFISATLEGPAKKKPLQRTLLE